MKTVVATYMVWMRDVVGNGPPFPPLNLLLVGNEENGEVESYGTPHVLADLEREAGWVPELMVVGERTGEQGNELHGAVCTSNRGIARITLTATGPEGHTGTGTLPADLLDRLIEARSVLSTIFQRRLTVASLDGWESTARFPFLTVGTPGVFNITAAEGVLGIELRPIPEDDLEGCVGEVSEVFTAMGFGVRVELQEAGVICPPDNPHLRRLLAAVNEVTGDQATLGRKRPGSSARFAPGGNAVVWGQTGHGPHSPEEWHYIPSIEPYLRVLDDFGERTREAVEGAQPTE
jgi:acetylornithine deacetylase/succinyl-diaminopimelate desuccinylase-like protein